MQILVVEDENAIREMISFALERAGFSVSQAGNVGDAQQQLEGPLPDLIILDWMLPDMSGVEFARTLYRDRRTGEVPVIMLTARGDERDKLRGFDAGVDDYITKPFSPRELIARVKAILRRSTGSSAIDVMRAEGLRLDSVSHRVFADEQQVEIAPTEFRLLRHFMSYPERVFSRGQLLDRVWGSTVYIDERTVDVHIRRLRKNLESGGYDRFIQTVRGAGYRFSTRA